MVRMKEKTPQEKKALSYAKDRRNAYGANDKASRNSIPKRKAEVNRAYRKNISDALKVIAGPIDLERADEVEHIARSVKRSDWKKFPDTPLGEVVEQKLESRVSHVGRGKSALKAVREFVENLEIESEQIELDKWVARAKEYPWIVVNAVSKLRAVEKLQHIMTVAKRNDQGADISIQIDGEFITPTLTK
jgi:hypothetical protein